MKVFRGMNWALWLLLLQAIGWFGIGIIVVSGILPVGILADKIFMVVGSWTAAGLLTWVVSSSVRIEREEVQQ